MKITPYPPRCLSNRFVDLEPKEPKKKYRFFCSVCDKRTKFSDSKKIFWDKGI